VNPRRSRAAGRWLWTRPRSPGSRHGASTRATERLAWGPAWTDAGLVFTREDGRPLHPREVTRAFTRHVLAAELPIIRLHDLRHTHATLALAAGVHPKIVQERLGHANIAITLDTYSHAVPALEEQAARTVAALVFGGGG
jgi:integrase